jgi:hypothetical protein
MQGTSRSEVAAELERCARLCADTAELHVERHGDAVGAEVVSGLLLAAAAMETAVRVVDDNSPAHPIALMIVATLARDAIDAAERRGLDETLLLCVATLRRVVALCDAA